MVASAGWMIWRSISKPADAPELRFLPLLNAGLIVAKAGYAPPARSRRINAVGLPRRSNVSTVLHPARAYIRSAELV